MNSKQAWTQQEDDYLRNNVPTKAKVDWVKLTANLNSKFPDHERSAKQCRQRYINYSKFSQASSESTKWQPEQLEILFRQFNKIGPRWNQIAKFIPLKSGNTIKNKFYGGLRKLIRKINQIQLQQRKTKKKLKYESVVRIIEAPESLPSLDSELKRQSSQLREKVTELISKSESQFDELQVTDLINQINKFNLATRSYRTRRRRLPNQQQQSQNGEEAVDKKQEQPTVKQVSNEKEDQKKSSIEAILRPKVIELIRMPDKITTRSMLSTNQRASGEVKIEQIGTNIITSMPTLKQVDEANPNNQAKGDEYQQMFPEQSSPLEESDLL